MKPSRSFGITLVCLLLIAAAGLVYLGMGDINDPKNRVDAELLLIRQDKLSEAYFTYTSKEFQASTSLEQFKAFVRAHPEFKKDASLDWGLTEEQGALKTIEVELDSIGQEPLKLSFQMIKENEEWKILNIKAHTATDNNIDSPLVKAITQTLEYFLKVLKNREPERAYKELTNSGFKTQTTLEAFKDFVSNYPILYTFTHSSLEEISTAPDQSLAKVKLGNDLQESIVEFTLLLTKEGWKIQGVQVLDQDIKPGVMQPFRNEDLSGTINQQLKAIHAGNLKEAYDRYTAKAFREATSFEDFEKFIQANPILKEQINADMLKLTFNNNVGIYSVKLKTSKKVEQEADFSMINEGDGWKVLQIQLYENAK